MAWGFSSSNIVTGWLNSLRGTNFTAPAGSFAKLHTGDPGAAGTANAAAGDTSRKTFSLAAPSGNAVAISGTPPTWTNGGTSETIAGVSVWDASSSGNFDYSIQLATPQPWVATNTFTLTSLTIAVAPVAA